LGSGSAGNAVVVESEGTRLLLDAGFSCRELEKRMRSVGIDPKTIAAVVLTHEHEDHVRGVARFAGRHDIPVWATDGTITGARLRGATAATLKIARSGQPIEIGRLRVEPFAIPHDAREPVGFVVEDALGRRVGLVADLGARSRLAWGRLRDLDVLLLETNHDLELLRSGPYPWSLKQRIASGHGHLSNRNAADGLPELMCDRLKTIVAYHLSRTNNLPALAVAAVAEQLDTLASKASVLVSDQFEPTPWIDVAS
jgi:phosphoribosyl 1,2-cyclic phosphodiesterase